VWRLREEILTAEAEKGLRFIVSAEVVVQNCCNGCCKGLGWAVWWVRCNMA